MNMGLFDFFKPKKSELSDMLDQLHAKIFPKGEKDMNAVTDALLYILNNKISRVEARNIAVKSVAISKISEEFKIEGLRQHLAGYCLHHFTDKQVESFHSYIVFLMVADLIFRKTPSEVVRDGEQWIIP